MVTKILLFILIFASLFLLKEAIMFIRLLLTGENNMTTWRLVGIGASIAYILTIIITGFAL